MLVEAQDRATGETLYFELNCPLRTGSTHTFVWFDGNRKVLTVAPCEALPEGTTATHAAFDVSSHEINVQQGR